MSCFPRAELQRFLAGELSAAAAAALAAHVEDCAACEQVLAELAGAQPPLLRPAPAGDAEAANGEPPPEFLDHLRNCLAPTSGLHRAPGRTEDWQSTPAPEKPVRAAGEPATGQVPAAVPGYEILAELSRGGMGVVYKARQIALGRVVALKMILAAAHAGQALRARFRTEAEAVARLQHPNIVQIYDVGEHAGRPYFSMELIDGPTLTAACRGQPQPPAAAAALVEVVARAVHCAHVQGIIHRDLKPDNILLASGGVVRGEWSKVTAHHAPLTTHQPKLIDFGLAKRQGDVQLTQQGQILGTPSYMAPEQVSAKGADVGPATDVYALGAVLYELLTGRPPFLAESVEATLTLVLREEPIPLRRLQPKVPRDLETICLTCLHKEPGRRYGSAQALAQDLHRYVADEPIRARPVGRVERAVKWARRHPATAAVLVLSVVLVVVAVSAGLWYWSDRAQRAETEAQKLAAEKALAVQKAREAGQLDQVEKALAGAVASLAKERQDLHTKLGQPLGAAQLMSHIDGWQARVDKLQSDWTKADFLATGNQDLLDPSWQGQLQALKKQVDADQNDLELGKKLDAIRLKAATLTNGKFDWTAAAGDYAKVFAGLKLDVPHGAPAAVAAQIDKLPMRLVLVAALDHWAEVAPYTKGQGKADAQLVAHLLQVASSVDAEPWRAKVRQAVAAPDKAALQQLAGGADLAQQTPQIILHLASNLPKEGKVRVALLSKALVHHPADFWLHFMLGNLLTDPAAQVGCYRAALAVRPKSNVAHNNLGNALQEQQQYAAAIAHYQQALLIDPNDAHAHNNWGNALSDQKQYAEAIGHYQQALLINPNDAYAHYNWGNALYHQKQYTEAIGHYQKALLIDPNYAEAHHNWGNALYHQKQYTEAIGHYQQALLIDPNFARAHTSWGDALQIQQQNAEAIGHYQQALRIDPNQAEAHHNLGSAYGKLGLQWLAQGQVAQAKEAFLLALKQFPPGHPIHHVAQKQLAQCEQQLLALEQKLTAVLTGQAQPKNGQEQLALADKCWRDRQLYATAVRFYPAGLADQPGLAKLHRYHAACAAVLAAAGQGKDADQLGAKEKTKLRQQALAWLKQELEFHERQTKGGSPLAVEQLAKELARWQSDPQLASIRDDKALPQLPLTERTDWQAFWTAVGELGKKAAATQAK